MPNIKLTYFNGKGRGETARLILAYGGMHYEDRRVSFGNIFNFLYQLYQFYLLNIRGHAESEAISTIRPAARAGG